MVDDALMNNENKKNIALFYIHLMSIDKEIVTLINNTHTDWLKAEADYDHWDRVIQRDNINVRIPAHLDEEDKMKFELIRQNSSFTDKDFYQKYLRADSIEIMRRESSEGGGGEDEGQEGMKFDLDEDSNFDDFDDDDLDSLLLSNVSIPTLHR